MRKILLSFIFLVTTIHSMNAVYVEYAIDSLSHHEYISKNADTKIQPASLTKLLTTYIIFDYIAKGKLSLTSEVTISKYSFTKGNSTTGSSTMFLEANDKVTLDQLIKGIIVVSGNDACIAAAEYIAGNETDFSILMNKYAKNMGLRHSHFVNSTGWPNKNHYSTAKDLLILTQRLFDDFPQFRYYFTIPSFKYNNIKQYNRNSLVKDKSIKAIGFKTGHIAKEGYSIIFGYMKKNIITYGIIANASKASERIQKSYNMMRKINNNQKITTLYKKNSNLVDINVINSNISKYQLKINYDIYNINDRYIVKLQYKDNIIAPLPKNSYIGDILWIDKNTNQIVNQKKIYTNINIEYSLLSTIMKFPYNYIKSKV